MWTYNDHTYFTRDINVASWMETSCKIASRTVKRLDWNRQNAEAIDYDHVDQTYYNWRLYRSKPYGSWFTKKNHYIIKRYEL